MEISVKLITLFLAVFLTGLSSGLFFAWAVSVIPGTKRVPDRSYLETMQQINRAILNIRFFLIFFGSLLLMLVSSYLQYKSTANLSFWLILGAALSYLIGTFGVTVFGNVPMNESLDKINLDQFSIEKLKLTRDAYESRWNRFHMIRTAFSLISFTLLLLAVFLRINTSLV